jgi:hypothetical protein
MSLTRANFTEDQIIKDGTIVDARAYGTSQNNTTIDAATAAIGSDNKTLVLAPGAWTIAAHCTIPNNVTLRCEGSLLSVATGVNLTINGGIEAGLTQIFSLTGTGLARFATTTGPADTQGNIREVYPQWWGFTTAESAANNATAFNACLAAALGAGVDIYIPAGRYDCDEVSWAKVGAGWESGIKIYGAASGMYEADESSSILDFSGIAGTDVAIHFDNTGPAAGGSLVGLTFENLAIYGPATVGTTKGIFIEGDQTAAKLGSLDLEFNKVVVKRFSTGIEIKGSNNWPLRVIRTFVVGCDIGVHLNNRSTSGLWESSSFSSCTSCVVFSGTSNQTIMSCLFQSSTRGFVVDTTGFDAMDINLINCYFESMVDNILLGYDSAGVASVSGNLRSFHIQGGSMGTPTGQVIKCNKWDAGSIIGNRGIWDFVVAPIQGITKASPAVVTSIAHGLSDADIIHITNTVGMTEVNGTTFAVQTIDADTFSLRNEADSADIDSSAYTTYSAGGQIAHANGWAGKFPTGLKTPGRNSDTQHALIGGAGAVKTLAPVMIDAASYENFGPLFKTLGTGRNKYLDEFEPMSGYAAAGGTITAYSRVPPQNTSGIIEANFITKKNAAEESEGYHLFGVFSRTTGNVTVHDTDYVEMETGGQNNTVTIEASGTALIVKIVVNGVSPRYAVGTVKMTLMNQSAA